MKIVFISINEPLDSGLLQSQFVKPAESLVSKEVEVTIINVHRPFQNKFFNANVKVINIPFLIPFRFINFTFLYYLNEVLTFIYAGLIYRMVNRNSKICCRGYVAGMTGYWLKKIFNISYIFDPRSLYVHENIGKKLKHGTNKHRYWLCLEKRVVLNSEKVISVSSGQANYYAKEYSVNSNRSVIIPCYSSEKVLIDLEKRSEIRNSIGYNNNDLVITYLGSLNQGWNNIDLYKRYFSQVLQLGHKLLIVSQDKESLLADEFFKHGEIKIFKQGEFVNGLKVEGDFIQVADYGIVLLQETADWFTRLTVKFVDYTSNGLPVIIHKNVGEAYNLSKIFDISPSFTIANPNEIDEIIKPTFLERIKIQNWANDYFSLNNAKKILHQ